MDRHGFVYVSKTKPVIKNRNVLFTNGSDMVCVFHIKQEFKDWRASVHKIDKRNLVTHGTK
jgi:hypothetical protein